MRYSHALALLGGALGTVHGLTRDVSDPEDYEYEFKAEQPEGQRREIRAVNTISGGLNGALVGSSVGSLIDKAVNWYAVNDLTEHLENYPSMTRNHLKRLIRYAPKDLPIYLQTKGDLDNAFYTDGDTGLLDGSWTDARTGKALKEIPQGRGVYVGKNFRYAPILAHELGHASSIERHGGDTGTSIGAYSGLASIGLLLAGGLATRKWNSTKNVNWLYGALGMGAAGLGAGILSDALKTREERRASDTAAAYLQRLKGISKARREQGLDLLSRAYRTYSPLQLGPAYRPDANKALL